MDTARHPSYADLCVVFAWIDTATRMFFTALFGDYAEKPAIAASLPPCGGATCDTRLLAHVYADEKGTGTCRAGDVVYYPSWGCDIRAQRRACVSVRAHYVYRKTCECLSL